MKNSANEKKMSLKRATVTNLTRVEMTPVKGGIVKTEWCTMLGGTDSCAKYCLQQPY